MENRKTPEASKLSRLFREIPQNDRKSFVGKSAHRLTINQWFIPNNFLVSNALRSVSDKQTRTGKAIKNCE